VAQVVKVEIHIARNFGPATARGLRDRYHTTALPEQEAVRLAFSSI
jgi:hypothetical protein